MPKMIDLAEVEAAMEEFRISQRFAAKETARTQDEGIVWAFVPKSFATQ